MDYQKERTSYVERAQDYIRETSKGVRLTNLALILASSINIGACGTTNGFRDFSRTPVDSLQSYAIKFWEAIKEAGAKDDCSGLGDGTNLDGKKIWYCTGPDGGDGGPGGGDGGAGGAGGDGGGSGSGGAGAGT